MKNERTFKEEQNVFWIGLCILSMGAAFLVYGLEKDVQLAYRTGILSCVLLIPIWMVLRKLTFVRKHYERTVMLAWFIFGMTMLLVLLSAYADTYFFWIGGSVCLTVLFPSVVGMLFSFFFWCLFCFLVDAEASYEIFALLLGIALCLGVHFLKRKQSVIFVFMAVLAVYTVLFAAMTRGSSAYFEPASLIAMTGIVVELFLAKLLYERVCLQE